MDHKDADGQIHSDVLDELAPGEPFFVLPAREKFSLPLVRRWFKRNTREGVATDARLEEAEAFIAAMKKWPAGG